MHRTLKETLTKLALQTGEDWVALLPYTLFRVRNSPYQLCLTPFKIMFGYPTPLVPSLQSELIAQDRKIDLTHGLKALSQIRVEILPRLKRLTLLLTPLIPIASNPQTGFWSSHINIAVLSHTGKAIPGIPGNSHDSHPTQSRQICSLASPLPLPPVAGRGDLEISPRS